MSILISYSVVYHPFPTSNHNLGRILACISGTYASFGAYEVASYVGYCCKNTKKIPIA